MILRSEDISEIEQILVLQNRDRRLDARKTLLGVSALLSAPLITYPQHSASLA